MSLPESFFERVAGEIHQQMEGVLALTERLARQPLGADAQACVAGVAEAAGSVRYILQSGADLKAAHDGALAMEPAPCALNDLIDDIQARWQGRAAASGVTLLVAFEGDAATLALVDANRLMQVFDAFIAQAVAGVRQGAVEVRLRVAPEAGALRVEGRVRGGSSRALSHGDEDIEEMEALFGLEIAIGVELGRRIVQGLQGEVYAEPNRGAGETLVFSFLAPEAAPEPEAADRAPVTRPAHILVVDDNATNRMVAETLCEMFDCTSESASDGVEAVAAASTGRFDLILMDIKMPGLDGVAATRAIRSLSGPASKVPIIALTANADPDDAAGYIAAGMNGVVEKPMKPDTLLRALQENLADPAAEAA
jgi:two-component system, sensor histidine kinase